MDVNYSIGKGKLGFCPSSANGVERGTVCFVRGSIYAVAKIILLACRCFVSVIDPKDYFPKGTTLPERAERSSRESIAPFCDERGERSRFGA